MPPSTSFQDVGSKPMLPDTKTWLGVNLSFNVSLGGMLAC